MSRRRAASGALLLVLGFADLGWAALVLAPRVLLDVPTPLAAEESPLETAVLRAAPTAIADAPPGASTPAASTPAAPPPAASAAVAPPSVATTPPSVTQPATLARAVGQDSSSSLELLFRRNNTSLTGEAEDELRRVATRLRQERGLQVEIRGHSCRLGTRSLNYWLSFQRAKAVETFLLRHGVEPSRIRVEALGGTEPRDPGTDPAAFARNRRVELIWR